MMVLLTEKQSRVRELYFEMGLTHSQIAGMLRCGRPAVTRLVDRVVQAYEREGKSPPARPGVTLRTVKLQTLSGAWDGNEYRPSRDN